VTIEAALGVALLSMTLLMCMQFLLIGVQQVRLATTTGEAARIAAASGDLTTRLSQAKDFISRECAGSRSQITSDGSQITVVVTLETRVFFLPFAPVLTAQSQSPLVDSLAVM
jgi:hypothetical protein